MEATGEAWVSYISRTKTTNGKSFQTRKHWLTLEPQLQYFKKWVMPLSAKGATNTQQFYKLKSAIKSSLGLASVA